MTLNEKFEKETGLLRKDCSLSEYLDIYSTWLEQHHGEWIKVETRVPDKSTRYARRFGVSILAYDMQEALDTTINSTEPFDVLFNFKEIKFKQSAHTGKGEHVWVDACLTHWKELPEGPVPLEKVKDKNE